MNTRQSYVISVSASTGCYRHIQIAADATLFVLHCAILNAFGFEDEHQHAFFMDNRLWSNADCYRSTGENPTRKCKLSSLALAAGASFQYLFDFGDEWVFHCKFLRALDEPCDLPRIIRSKGDAPQQYGQESEFDADEDGEEMELPELFSKAELKKHYLALNLPEETVTMLHQYFAAMAKLYGIIPLRKALEIINAQNEPISEQAFLAFAEIARHEEHYYAILGEDELYADGKKSAPMEREIVHESLYAVDLAEYDEMQDRQQGKPYYIPSKERLLPYADEDYFETTSQSNAVERYLRQEKKLNTEKAAELLLEVQLHATSNEMNMQLVLDDLNRTGM